MQSKRLLTATPLLFIPLAQPLLAEEPNNQWTGDAELGASVTTGNSDSTNINGKLRLVYLTGEWEHRLRLEALRASEDGEDTANRVLGEFESRYAITERDYLFGVLRGTRDGFSGYEYQASTAAGYGRNLWISEQGHWDAEIGPGVRITENESGDRETNAILRISSGFEHQISNYARFNQDVVVLSGQDNTEIESITGVSASLTDTLAMKLSYTIQHNTDVPAGTEETGTYTSVNLVYNFN